MEKISRWKKAGSRRAGGLGEAERRSLLQLAVCLVLFLTVFLGRGAFPAQTETWRENLLQLLEQDTDFKAVFSGLGQAVDEQAPVLDTLDQVWREVFGVQEPELVEPDREASAALRLEAAAGTLPIWPQPALSSGMLVEPTVTPPPVVELTAAQRELGVADSITPVMGVFSSGFGMREHPIDGGEKFHHGVDLATAAGTDVLAFADGRVEFIGEGPDLGLYIQLDHGNGLTTLYAHCSQLCAKTGQQVKMGDVIAKVGETGKATGPHLHLELRKNGEELDPLPYVEYLSQ